MACLNAAVSMTMVCILQGHMLIAFFSNGIFHSCTIFTDKHVSWSLINSRASCLILGNLRKIHTWLAVED